MAGNLSYFAKKKLHPKIFVKFKFDENNAADLPAAEIQKDKPKDFQQTAITSYFKK